jgi:hypothetical protein
MALNLVGRAQTAKGGTMFNNILTLQRPIRLICFWVRTGNPRNPLACVWVDSNARNNCKEASSSNDKLGGMLLCA